MPTLKLINTNNTQIYVAQKERVMYSTQQNLSKAQLAN